MKPTLFAEDVERQASNKLYALRKSLDSLALILPRRCSGCHKCKPNEAWGQPTSINYQNCDGRGWLYPDPPDIPYYAAWKQDEASMALWRRTLEHVWRAMGITDED